MSESKSKSDGISFFGLLTILFIGLKLTNYISWSWFWVLSPITIAFVVAFFLIILIALIGQD